MDKAQIQLALEVTHVGAWELDMHSGRLVCTPQARTLWGFPPDVPLSIRDLLTNIHPDDRERVARLLEKDHRALQDGFECRLIWPDGSLHWLSGGGQAIRDERGRLVRQIGVVVEITDRKRAEEELRESELRFRRLMESNLIGIVVSDLEGTIHEANDAFLNLVGYTQEDLAASRVNVREMTPRQYQERTAQAIKDILATGMAHPFETEAVTRDGRRVPLLVGGASFCNVDATQFTINFVVDLTARKELERQKDLFLSMIGHELRTPLTILKGMLQLLERRAKRLAATAVQFSPEVSTFASTLLKDLTTAERQVNVQTRLVNDLLDVSSITAGKLSLARQPWDLLALVRETVDDLRCMAPERTLLFDLPAQTTVPVLVDRDRIKQVVVNYLTNALRCSSPEQPVSIGVILQNERARVWVRDQGPGLSKQAQKNIWQRFRRNEDLLAYSGSEQGLGLGLHICQSLIEAHQGEVGVESEPGAGSTFWFCLPVLDQTRSCHENGNISPFSKEKEKMTLPTIDETEGVWILRTRDQGYHVIQEVFPKETEIDRAHRANCLWLIRRGSLQPEHGDPLPPAERVWKETERYCRMPQ
jgi:PAS domain S-box-containing protein